MSLIKKSIIKDLLKVGGSFEMSDSFYKKTSVLSFGNETDKQLIPDSWIKVNYKTYPRLKKILLPKPEGLRINLGDAIVKRRSRRIFVKDNLNLEKLSNLIYFSAGIVEKGDSWDKSLRAYPSGGGRYPLEVYLVINNVRSIEKGLYHYNVKDHALELLLKEDLSKRMGYLTGQKFVKKASVVMLITGICDRTRIKYEERGFRYILMECGHLCQNVYLVCEALKLSGCAIGGFIDHKINRLLDVQYTSEKVLYLIAIGGRGKHEDK
ncbi:MAG: SagB/ThcOx family dehydrogenase [Candidatus Shapirobacteria bacterium]|nr:SagB/ThcOx family dehydrogenase [Candidatus Shapirobacteria bacterium]